MIRVSSISENPGLRAISKMVGLGLGDPESIQHLLEVGQFDRDASGLDLVDLAWSEAKPFSRCALGKSGVRTGVAQRPAKRPSLHHLYTELPRRPD